ncbi:MAG: DUF3261 domain-containing protein [Kiloniellaceae bacterium]
MIKLIAMVVLAAGLTGCVQAVPEDAQEAERGVPLLSTPLLPGSLGHALSLSQIVTAEFNGEQRSLRVEVDITADRMVMVGLSLIGAPLFTLELDSQGLRASTLEGAALPFDPRHILSDFQLAHWPREQIARELSRHGNRLLPGTDAAGREIYGPQRQLLVKIDYPPAGGDGDLIIQHFDRPYQLQIHTIESEAGQG